MPIKLEFGVAQEGDELVNLDYFVNVPLGIDRLILSCVKSDEPKEKEDKKMTSVTSKIAAILFDNFFYQGMLGRKQPIT